MDKTQLKNDMWDCANKHLSQMYLELIEIGGHIPLPHMFTDKIMRKTEKVINEYIEYVVEIEKQKKGVKND